jgi:hypothetical protein
MNSCAQKGYTVLFFIVKSKKILVDERGKKILRERKNLKTPKRSSEALN